jgi:hypothetical protein
LCSANIIPGKKKPVKQAKVADLAFFLHRLQSANKLGWAVFNQSFPSEEPELTSLGYLPIIIAPAHELDTLNTVVK